MNTPSDEPKAWYLSRGIVGPLIAGLCAVAAIFGWSLDPEEWTELLLSVIAVVFSAVGIWGRLQANRPIRVLKAEKAGPFKGPGNPAKR